MSLKRIFTGTFVESDYFKVKYDEVISDFKNITKGKWVEKENLHFTYQFIGNTEESIVDEIIESLKEYLIEYNSKLIVKGLGSFPNSTNPRVLFANVINSDKIVYEIQIKTTTILEKFGFKAEKRDYHPHITLQRIKFADKRDFRKMIEKYSDTLFCEVNSFKFNLIESNLTPNGAIYKIIL